MPKGPKDATVLAEGGSVYLMAGSANRAGQDAFAAFAISPEGQKLGWTAKKAFIVQLPVNKTVDISSVRPDSALEGVRRRLRAARPVRAVDPQLDRRYGRPPRTPSTL